MKELIIESVHGKFVINNMTNKFVHLTFSSSAHILCAHRSHNCNIFCAACVVQEDGFVYCNYLANPMFIGRLLESNAVPTHPVLDFDNKRTLL